jgi:D-glycero-alpha-D-manno-heptose-7-phosphate kinase
MITVQVPLRISLFGGGTDFPSYYERFGGSVLSSTIDKYIYVTVKKRFDDKIRVGYSRTEMVDHPGELKHELIREALNVTGIRHGVEITTMADIPTQGSGLGSSSAVTVGTLHALYALMNHLPDAKQLFETACRIEMGILRKPIGVQDQYAVAHGGLRAITLRKSGILGLALDTGLKHIQQLEQNLLLFFTGITRQSSSILTEQKERIDKNQYELNMIANYAFDALEAINGHNIDEIGQLLHESWQLKKRLASKVSNPEIDSLYQTARYAGATGGKITGAGGGGFLLLYCPGGTHDKVRAAIPGLQELPFRFSPYGSRVIFDNRR